MKQPNYIFDEPTFQRQQQRKREVRERLADKILRALDASLVMRWSATAVEVVERVLEESER